MGNKNKTGHPWVLSPGKTVWVTGRGSEGQQREERASKGKQLFLPSLLPSLLAHGHHHYPGPFSACPCVLHLDLIQAIYDKKPLSVPHAVCLEEVAGPQLTPKGVASGVSPGSHSRETLGGLE